MHSTSRTSGQRHYFLTLEEAFVQNCGTASRGDYYFHSLPAFHVRAVSPQQAVTVPDYMPFPAGDVPKMSIVEEATYGRTTVVASRMTVWNMSKQ